MVLFPCTDRLSRYVDSLDDNKMILRPSYLYHEAYYIGKMAYSYWDGPISQTVYEIVEFGKKKET